MSGPVEHRETADLFHGQIVRRESHRVILDRDGIQWILQRRKGGAGASWRALGYYTTKKALLRAWTALCGRTAPEIEGLPDTVRGCSDG